jgi:hypothetical protein
MFDDDSLTRSGEGGGSGKEGKENDCDEHHCV